MTQEQNTKTVALSMENMKELFCRDKHLSKQSPVVPTRQVEQQQTEEI